MLFFTFCVYIGRHSKEDMIWSLENQMKSIHKHVKDYKLICFTNFNINIDGIEFRPYYDKTTTKLYNDDWLNLSYNKINIYKDLHDEFNKDFIWIDLDTYVTHDISYIDDLSHIFLQTGGLNEDPYKCFSNRADFEVPCNKYIQGDFWKLSIELYNDLMNTLHETKLKQLILEYDLQGLFNYHINVKNKLNKFNILGSTINPDTINGLSVWDINGNTHANLNGLNNLYYENNVLKSNFYKNKKIHILSFTFFTLKRLKHEDKLKELISSFTNVGI